MDNHHYQSIVDALGHPAMVVKDASRIIAANAPADTLFETPLLNLEFIRVLRHPEALKCLSLAAGGQVRQSCDLTLSLNTMRTYEMTAGPLVGGAYILVTFLDVSAELDAEKARSTFVANVSHELRSPLTTLMGIVETLRGPARDDSKARDMFLDLMQAETQRMSRLVGDLLSLSKLEAKEHVRPNGQINIVNVLKGVESALAASQLSYGGRINIIANEDLPSVLGDADELTEVFQNLLENALKYSTPDTKVDVSVTARAPNNPSSPSRVVVEIQDEGEGISPKHIPRLTERFYRVDKGRSRETGGTGLGLAITKHILNRHRARFHIRSEEGVGTRVTVSLRS